MAYRFIITVLLASFLTACGSSGPKYTSKTIDAAEAQGQLAALYQQMSSQLEQMNRKSSAGQALQVQLNDVGSRLGKSREQEIRQSLKPADASIALFSLADLREAIKQAEPIKAWDNARYVALVADLEGMSHATGTAIDNSLKRLGELTDKESAAKLNEFDQLIWLTGGNGAAEFTQQQNDYIEDLYQKGLQAVELKQYTLAEQYLSVVNERQPGYKTLSSVWGKIKVGALEQNFWDLLAQGKPDAAYDEFVALTKSDNFELVRPQVAAAGSDISNYFLELAQNAHKKGDFSTAYSSFSRARYIRDSLGKKGSLTKADLVFIKDVYSRYQKAESKGEVGIAYGYLLMLKELDENHSAVKRDLRTLTEKTLQLAKIKVATAPFSNATTDREFGKSLASKVSQYLLEKISQDITLLQQAEFDQIQNNYNDWDSSLYLSYYKVEGNIQQSAVEINEKRFNKKRRVVTGYKKEVNPEHTKWLALSSSKRKEIAEPSPTVDVPQTEDIDLASITIQKTGIFSAIFRLVNPRTHEVLFVDSVTEKQEYEGETIEGVELGVFKQEGKAADLPSDSEILEALSRTISVKIGDSLIEKLSDPEKQYHRYAYRAIEEGKTEAAARNFAYATVLTARKQGDAEALTQELKLTVSKVKP